MKRLMSDEQYVMEYKDTPLDVMHHAKDLCFMFNNTLPSDSKRSDILKELLGTYNDRVYISTGFNCDYGKNIHMKGMCLINYNVTMLDTSPIYLGKNVMIGPHCVLSCVGHPIDVKQRREGLTISAPITIEDDVWLGSNVTVLKGVTIGKGSVIGAGSVVTKDIPANVVANGVPCVVKRKITEEDKVEINF